MLDIILRSDYSHSSMRERQIGHRALAHMQCVLEHLLLALDWARSWPGTKFKLTWTLLMVQVVAQRRWLPGAAGQACGAGLLLRARGAEDLGRDDGGLG